MAAMTPRTSAIAALVLLGALFAGGPVPEDAPPLPALSAFFPLETDICHAGNQTSLVLGQCALIGAPVETSPWAQPFLGALLLLLVACLVRAASFAHIRLAMRCAMAAYAAQGTMREARSLVALVPHWQPHLEPWTEYLAALLIIWQLWYQFRHLGIDGTIAAIRERAAGLEQELRAERAHSRQLEVDIATQSHGQALSLAHIETLSGLVERARLHGLHLESQLKAQAQDLDEKVDKETRGYCRMINRQASVNKEKVDSLLQQLAVAKADASRKDLETNLSSLEARLAFLNDHIAPRSKYRAATVKDASEIEPCDSSVFSGEGSFFIGERGESDEGGASEGPDTDEDEDDAALAAAASSSDSHDHHNNCLPDGTLDLDVTISPESLATWDFPSTNSALANTPPAGSNYVATDEDNSGSEASDEDEDPEEDNNDDVESEEQGDDDSEEREDDNEEGDENSDEREILDVTDNDGKEYGDDDNDVHDNGGTVSSEGDSDTELSGNPVLIADRHVEESSSDVLTAEVTSAAETRSQVFVAEDAPFAEPAGNPGAAETTFAIMPSGHAATVEGFPGAESSGDAVDLEDIYAVGPLSIVVPAESTPAAESSGREATVEDLAAIESSGHEVADGFIPTIEHVCTTEASNVAAMEEDTAPVELNGHTATPEGALGVESTRNALVNDSDNPADGQILVTSVVTSSDFEAPAESMDVDVQEASTNEHPKHPDPMDHSTDPPLTTSDFTNHPSNFQDYPSEPNDHGMVSDTDDTTDKSVHSRLEDGMELDIVADVQNILTEVQMEDQSMSDANTEAVVNGVQTQDHNMVGGIDEVDSDMDDLDPTRNDDDESDEEFMDEDADMSGYVPKVPITTTASTPTPSTAAPPALATFKLPGLHLTNTEDEKMHETSVADQTPFHQRTERKPQSLSLFSTPDNVDLNFANNSAPASRPTAEQGPASSTTSILGSWLAAAATKKGQQLIVPDSSTATIPTSPMCTNSPGPEQDPKLWAARTVPGSEFTKPPAWQGDRDEWGTRKGNEAKSADTKVLAARKLAPLKKRASKSQQVTLDAQDQSEHQPRKQIAVDDYCFYRPHEDGRTFPCIRNFSKAGEKKCCGNPKRYNGNGVVKRTLKRPDEDRHEAMKFGLCVECHLDDLDDLEDDDEGDGVDGEDVHASQGQSGDLLDSSSYPEYGPEARDHDIWADRTTLRQLEYRQDEVSGASNHPGIAAAAPKAPEHVQTEQQDDDSWSRRRPMKRSAEEPTRKDAPTPAPQSTPANRKIKPAYSKRLAQGLNIPMDAPPVDVTQGDGSCYYRPHENGHKFYCSRARFLGSNKCCGDPSRYNDRGVVIRKEVWFDSKSWTQAEKYKLCIECHLQEENE